MKMERVIIQIPKPIKDKLNSLKKDGYTASGYIRSLFPLIENAQARPLNFHAARHAFARSYRQQRESQRRFRASRPLIHQVTVDRYLRIPYSRGQQAGCRPSGLA